MKEIEFITVDDPQYERLTILQHYDRDHPLHRLYDYVSQYYGGLRRDVLNFFCDDAARNQLAKLIAEAQEPGLRNEWYRRLIRLLQCNAEADWYRMYLASGENKSRGYQQYFCNQLCSYAEMGIPVNRLRELYADCTAAYQLEYRVRTNDIIEDGMTSEAVTSEKMQESSEQTPMTELLQQLLQPMLEGQEKVQGMLETLLQEKKGLKEQREDSKNQSQQAPASIEEKQKPGENPEEKEEPGTYDASESGPEERAEGEREACNEHALKLAKFYQQLRLKRKAVLLRKMDPKQQLQELVIRMTQLRFSAADMAIVRGLISYDVSLEFLYTLISSEPTPTPRLKQIYEFLAYRQQEKTEV